jgi:hypothetical protein
MNKKIILICGTVIVVAIVAYLASQSDNVDENRTTNDYLEITPETTTNKPVENTSAPIKEVDKTESEESTPEKSVLFNGRALTAVDLKEINDRYGIDAVSGNYWYDRRSGAFGNIGGPAIGVMYPGHNFGLIQANASNGNSGVFYNGRELQQTEAVLVANLFGFANPVPGRYWMEANGNVGVEGNDFPLANIYAVIAAKGGGGGGDNIWSKGLYSAGNYYTGAGGQITQGYVSVPGYGPVSHGF